MFTTKYVKVIISEEKFVYRDFGIHVFVSLSVTRIKYNKNGSVIFEFRCMQMVNITTSVSTVRMKNI
jgi:hypothetical protein